MLGPRLHDAVTLRHFGAAGRLDVLAERCDHLEPPRWTRAVADEIEACRGTPECDGVLAADWIGDPIDPEIGELKSVVQLQVGLSDSQAPPLRHAGEAESIYFARKLGGTLVTDDNEAFDFALHHLGMGRVFDTIDILRDAVAMEDLTVNEAHLIANAIRNSGRSLRRTHPATLPPEYFN